VLVAVGAVLTVATPQTRELSRDGPICRWRSGRDCRGIVGLVPPCWNAVAAVGFARSVGVRTFAGWSLA
jgi:hypothetical protein